MRPQHLLAAPLFAALLAIPVHAKDTHCTSAEKQVAAITTKLPIEVDAVTQTTKAEMSCANKQILLTRSVQLKQSRMEADFKDFLQKQDNGYVCRDTSRIALVKAGWKWVISYTFKDGDAVKITAKCAE